MMGRHDEADRYRRLADERRQAQPPSRGGWAETPIPMPRRTATASPGRSPRDDDPQAGTPQRLPRPPAAGHRGGRSRLRPAGGSGRPRGWTGSPRSSSPGASTRRKHGSASTSGCTREPPGQHADGAGRPRSRGPEAGLALDHLARIKAGDRGTRATVRLNEGKAYSALGQNDRAESAWKEALRLEPRVPEAGWDLLGLYYVQGRREEAHRLGLELYAIEPDPRDRVDCSWSCSARMPSRSAPERLIKTLEPIVHAPSGGPPHRDRPGPGPDPQQPVRRGLAAPARVAIRPAGDADAWDALLRGLDERVGRTRWPWPWRVPAGLAADRRFERYRAALARSSGTGRRPPTPISGPGGPTRPTSRCSIGSAACLRPPAGRIGRDVRPPGPGRE